MRLVRKIAANLMTVIILIAFEITCFNAYAVDETIPHPIDERGLMSQIAIKTTRLFRPVEVIGIDNSILQKTELTIATGTVVVIENKDKTNHRLIFSPASSNDLVADFTSTVIGPEQLWGAEFIDPGEYPFKCTLHPEKEHGVITVFAKDAR